MAGAGLLTRTPWRAALFAGTAMAALAIPSAAQAVDGMEVLTGLANAAPARMGERRGHRVSHGVAHPRSGGHLRLYVSRLGVSQTF